jgi:hypothetical protein
VSGLRTWIKTGGNKKIHKLVQFELLDPIRIQFPCFVTDHGDLQSVPYLELAYQIDHFRVRFRLLEYEAPELGFGIGPLPVENHPIQVFFKRNLPLLVSGEVQAMPCLHFSPFQLKVCRRAFAGMMVPPVCEQDTANIHKQCCDGQLFTYLFFMFHSSILRNKTITAIDAVCVKLCSRCLLTSTFQMNHFCSACL